MILPSIGSFTGPDQVAVTLSRGGRCDQAGGHAMSPAGVSRQVTI